MSDHGSAARLRRWADLHPLDAFFVFSMTMCAASALLAWGAVTFAEWLR